MTIKETWKEILKLVDFKARLVADDNAVLLGDEKDRIGLIAVEATDKPILDELLREHSQ